MANAPRFDEALSEWLHRLEKESLVYGRGLEQVAQGWRSAAEHVSSALADATQGTFALPEHWFEPVIGQIRKVQQLVDGTEFMAFGVGMDALRWPLMVLSESGWLMKQTRERVQALHGSLPKECSKWIGFVIDALDLVERYLKDWYPNGVVRAVKAGTKPAPMSSVPPSRGEGVEACVQTEPILDTVRQRWYVDHFHDQMTEPIRVVVTHPRQSVSIDSCRQIVVEISGKCNSVVIHACDRLGLVLDDVVATVEVIRCKSCRLQLRGNVPSMSVDQTDGLTIYGAPHQVVTCCATGVNIVEWDEKDTDAEERETPVPQQFITRRDRFHPDGRGAWITEPLQHDSAA